MPLKRTINHTRCSVVQCRTIAIEILSVGAFASGSTGGQASLQLLQSPALLRRPGDDDGEGDED